MTAYPRPDEITPEWLTKVLQRNTDLSEAVVSRLDFKEIVGKGFSSIMGYLFLEYKEDRIEYPNTLFIKQKSRDPKIAYLMTRNLSYLKEVKFYQTLFENNPLNPPRCYSAEIDEQTSDFILLLEDIGDMTTLRQTEGHSLNQAKQFVGQLGQFHGVYMNSKSVKEAEWIPDYCAIADMGSKYFLTPSPPGCSCGEKFLFKHGDRVNHFFRDHAIELFNAWSKIYRAFSTMPMTLLHGDIHCANMSVSRSGMRVYDWQVLRRGPGVSDLIYYLSWLRSDVRDGNLDALLDIYYDAFKVQVGRGYDRVVFDNHLQFILLQVACQFILVLGQSFLETADGKSIADFWLKNFCKLSEQLGISKTWDSFQRGERQTTDWHYDDPSFYR